MTLVEDILNGKYFVVGSRDRLKAILISLVLLLAILIMGIDAYDTRHIEHNMMVWLENIFLVVLIVTYILFPKYISLRITEYITIFILCVVIVLALMIEGSNPYYELFWLATLPIYIFFFLGMKLGLKWSMAMVFSLLLTAANSLFQWTTVRYDFSFLMHITVGYTVISTLAYVLENERQDYEKVLLKTLKQKDDLLKEVHHRTKNNIQVMIALLDTQALKIDDSKYKKMFHSHVDRLKSMAFLHTNLYSGETFGTLNISAYLAEITKHFQNMTEHQIDTDIDHAVLDMQTAMNLGLIYNEALSNAIEHAYEKGEKNIISVSFKKENKDCVLRVQDRGKGFDQTVKRQTLGLSLMKNISRSLSQQELSIDTSEGTTVKVYCTQKREYYVSA